MKPLQQFYREFNALNQFDGYDAQGVPRIRFVKQLIEMPSKKLERLTKTLIRKWIINGQKMDDTHWRMNACYFEHLRRGTQKVFHRIYAEHYKPKTNETVKF